MRTILNFTLCMLMFCAACLSALAQSGNDVFQLPDGQARAAYQADIEAVLREKYRQKIETGVNDSILQWSVVDGELPAGLMVRTNGQVAGTPETAREQPYVFRVKVVDRALVNSSSLTISLSVVIAPPRLRLARIEGPALVPMEGSTPSSQGSGPQPAQVLVRRRSGSGHERHQSGRPRERGHGNSVRDGNPPRRPLRRGTGDAQARFVR